MTPLSIVGGFLGAGKTTLLNHLLRLSPGERVAVLVNDFGRVNIDAALIRHHDGETISLTNGCICCTIGDNLIASLIALQRRRLPPERIVIETSGVSDPGAVAEIGTVDPDLRLDGVIVLVDAEHIRAQATHHHLGDTIHRQLAAASVIILNKIDLIDSSRLSELIAWLSAAYPRARLISAIGARVERELLFGYHDSPPIVVSDNAQTHTQDFSSWTFTTMRPFARAKLVALLSSLPEGIFRAKGIVRISDTPNAITVAQVAGRLATLNEEASSAAPGESFIVLIGVPEVIDVVALEDSFNAALA